MTKKIPSCELEKELFNNVFAKTPDYIKNLDILNFDNEGEFIFTLKREHLYPHSEANPEGLNLLEWFSGYAKEAKVSTAGIRGPQNILYPQDTRFPINLVGIVLATLAKALVARDKYKGEEIRKLVGSEVRYNSDLYLDAIARIQAAQGIRTLTPQGRKTIPIWLASFLCYKLDLAGGEYIVGLTWEDPAATLVKSGAPVEVVFPKEGALYAPQSVQIIKNCKHPENAKKFVDYMLSEKIQNLVGTTLTVRPLRKNAKLADYMTPASKIKIAPKFNEKWVSENKEKFTKEFTKHLEKSM